MERARDAGRLVEIDLMRFLAALAVVYYHTVYPGSPARAAAQFGFLGVHVFFMISGFVILWTASRKDAYEYVASRVSRLYPTFWICVLLTYMLLPHAGESASPRELFANLTMVPTLWHAPMLDSVYWTLQVELRFYALILVLLLARQLPRIDGWLCAWLAYCALAHALPAHPRLETWLGLSSYAPLFIAGCLLYRIYSAGASPLRVAALLAAGALAIWASLGTEESGFTGRNDALVNAGVVLILMLAFAMFFLVAIGKVRLPRSAAWPWLGAMTYPLYLIHYRAVGALLVGVPKTSWHVALHVAISLGIALVLAALSERRLCSLFNRALLGLRARAQLAIRRQVA